MDLQKITEEVRQVAAELFDTFEMEGKVLVLGCSSSEIRGIHLGNGTSAEVGEAVVGTLLSMVREKNAFLAVQCCEHLNRALVVERELAEKNNLTIVSVVPALYAGGACAVAAYKNAKEPVMAEHIVADAGIDIGDTFIGMHVRHVQIPMHPAVQKVGAARVSCLGNRPKLVGGDRAQYE